MNTLKIAGLSALTLFGSIAAASAQATTAPVGYVTLASATNPIPANTDVRLSVPMEASVDFTGLAASAAGNVITVSGASFTANQFAPATGGYYVRIKNGASAGQTAEITENTTNTLTLALETGDDLTDVSSTTQIEIVKYFTLDTFFPSTIPNGTRVLFYNNDSAGINKSSSESLQFLGGVWLDSSFQPASATLYPGEAFTIRTPSTPITDLVITGNVPTVAHRIKLTSLNNSTQDFNLSFLSPVAEPIANSGLGFSAGDRLLVYDRTPGINKSSSQSLQFLGGQWLDSSFQPVGNTFMLEPGVGYVYRRASNSAGTVEWKDIQTYNQ